MGVDPCEDHKFWILRVEFSGVVPLWLWGCCVAFLVEILNSSDWIFWRYALVALGALDRIGIDFSFFSLIFRSFALSWLPFWGYRFFVFFVDFSFFCTFLASFLRIQIFRFFRSGDDPPDRRFDAERSWNEKSVSDANFLNLFFHDSTEFLDSEGMSGIQKGCSTWPRGPGAARMRTRGGTGGSNRGPASSTMAPLAKEFRQRHRGPKRLSKIARGHRPRALCVRASATWPSPRGGHGVGKFGRWRNYSSPSCFRWRIWQGFWFFSILLPEVRKPRRGVSGFWRRFDRS